MMKRGMLVFLLTAVYCFLTLGGAAAAKDTVTITFESDIMAASPYKAKSAGGPTMAVIQAIFQAPLRYETETGKMIPDLAESVEPMNNYSSFKITLRQDARFHNGDPVTSADARFSWQQFMDKNNPNMISTRMRAWKDIEIIDEKVFIIHYKKAQTDWATAVRSLYISSKKYYDQVGEKEFHAHPMGTGPFRFVRWEIGENIVLEAVDNHPQYKPFFKKLVFKVVQDQVTRLAMLETGQADLVYGLAPHDAVRLKRNNKVRVKEALIPSFYGIGLNSVAHPDLLDRPLRQAMLYAVDRQKIVDKIFLGAGYPMYTYSNVTEFGYDPDYKIPYDPEKAKELLKQSSYKPETPLTLTYEQRFANGPQVFEAIQGYFKQVGITMKMQRVEYGAYISLLRKKDPKVIMCSTVWHGIEDPTSRLIRSVKTNGMFTLYHGRQDMDELIVRQSQTFDEAKRREMIAQIRQIMFEDPVCIPLFGLKFLYATNSKIDYTWTQGTAQLYNIWEIKQVD